MSAVVVVIVGLVLYLIPTIVAAGRSKRNMGAILALNLLLGWTLVGWVISLVWALTHDRPEAQQVMYVNQSPTPPALGPVDGGSGDPQN